MLDSIASKFRNKRFSLNFFFRSILQLDRNFFFRYNAGVERRVRRLVGLPFHRSYRRYRSSYIFFLSLFLHQLRNIIYKERSDALR